MFRTLLVEDNQDFRHEVRDMLCVNFPSIEVFEADNADEALRQIKNVEPNLVIMDIRLPGGDGLQLTKQIKTDYPQVKVVILSGYDLPEYRQAAQDHGAECYIAKGSGSVDELVAVVRNLVNEKIAGSPKKKPN